MKPDDISAEKNADILDQAAAVTDFITANLVAEQRARAAPESHPDFDGKHCVEACCGVKIPSERLKLGRIRCVACQGRIEHARSAFRR